jgi:hypothetical protein
MESDNKYDVFVAYAKGRIERGCDLNTLARICAAATGLQRELQAYGAAISAVQEQALRQVQQTMAEQGGVKTVSFDGVGRFTQYSTRVYTTTDFGRAVDFLEKERDGAVARGIPLESVYSWLGRRLSSTRVGEYFEQTGALPDGVSAVDQTQVRFTLSKGKAE